MMSGNIINGKLTYILKNRGTLCALKPIGHQLYLLCALKPTGKLVVLASFQLKIEKDT